MAWGQPGQQERTGRWSSQGVCVCTTCTPLALRGVMCSADRLAGTGGLTGDADEDEGGGALTLLADTPATALPEELLRSSGLWLAARTGIRDPWIAVTLTLRPALDGVGVVGVDAEGDAGDDVAGGVASPLTRTAGDDAGGVAVRSTAASTSASTGVASWSELSRGLAGGDAKPFTTLDEDESGVVTTWISVM